MPNTDDLIQYGTIVNVDPNGKALVRVQIFERVTDWIPYEMKASKHIKIWIPPQIGEQVEVKFAFGETDGGVAEGSIYNKDCKEPDGADGFTTIVEWSNGARIEVNTQANTMKLNNPGEVTIDAPTTHMTGNLIVDGTITDEKGSVTHHNHSDVMSGSSNTGDRV